MTDPLEPCTIQIPEDYLTEENAIVYGVIGSILLALPMLYVIHKDPHLSLSDCRIHVLITFIADILEISSSVAAFAAKNRCINEILVFPWNYDDYETERTLEDDANLLATQGGYALIIPCIDLLLWCIAATNLYRSSTNSQENTSTEENTKSASIVDRQWELIGNLDRSTFGCLVFTFLSIASLGGVITSMGDFDSDNLPLNVILYSVFIACVAVNIRSKNAQLRYKLLRYFVLNCFAFAANLATGNLINAFMNYFVDESHGGLNSWLEGGWDFGFCFGKGAEAGGGDTDGGAAPRTEDGPPDVGKEACSTETDEEYGAAVRAR